MSKRRVRAAAACAAVLGALIAMPVHGAEEKSVLPPRADNAALNYLLAAAQLEKAKTEAEIKAIEFIERDFPKLPPAALKARPDAVDILEREACSLMLDLHEGAGKPKCQFDVDWEQGPEVLLPHLSLMRNLARHAVAVAKYQEFTGHPEKAAAIYADIAQMWAHMAKEPEVINGLVAIAVNNINTHAVVGFLSRDPPLEAVEHLMTALESVPDYPFPVDRWILGDGESFGDWFNRHPEGSVGLSVGLSVMDHPDENALVMLFHQNIERYNALASDPNFKSRVNRLKSVEIVATLQAAVKEYRENIRKLAALACEPYFKSGEAVAALQAAIEKRLEETQVETAAAMQAEKENQLEEMQADLAKGNPLLLLLAEDRRAYLTCNLSEAQLGMLRIMVAATLHKAKTGAYPETLEKLAGYFPKGLPKDPFTGKDFVYRLKEGLPRIESNPPESVRSDSNYFVEWSSLDLSRRRQQDAEVLKGFLEKPAAK